MTITQLSVNRHLVTFTIENDYVLVSKMVKVGNTENEYIVIPKSVLDSIELEFEGVKVGFDEQTGTYKIDISKEAQITHTIGEIFAEIQNLVFRYINYYKSAL